MIYKRLVLIFLFIKTSYQLPKNEEKCCNPRIFFENEKKDIFLWKRNALEVYKMCNETCVYSKLNDNNPDDEYCFGLSNNTSNEATCQAPDPGVEIGPINKTLTFEYLQDEIKDLNRVDSQNLCAVFLAISDRNLCLKFQLIEAFFVKT